MRSNLLHKFLLLRQFDEYESSSILLSIRPSNVNAIQISDNLLQEFENLYVVEDEDSIQKKKK